MKITHTTLTSQAPVSRPMRRFYSPELKIQVIQECRQGGASVTRVALAHGLTANIVRSWLRRSAQNAQALQPQQAFVAITIDEPAPAPQPPTQTQTSTPTPIPLPPAAPDIRIEVQRADARIVVNWPLAGSACCAAWLSGWLQ
jgi:transposase